MATIKTIPELENIEELENLEVIVFDRNAPSSEDAKRINAKDFVEHFAGGGGYTPPYRSLVAEINPYVDGTEDYSEIPALRIIYNDLGFIPSVSYFNTASVIQLSHIGGFPVSKRVLFGNGKATGHSGYIREYDDEGLSEDTFIIEYKSFDYNPNTNIDRWTIEVRVYN